MAFSEKLVALASLFLDTVGAVERKPFFIDFQLGMLDPPGKKWLSRFLLELMSEVADVLRSPTLQFTQK